MGVDKHKTSLFAPPKHPTAGVRGGRGGEGEEEGEGRSLFRSRRLLENAKIFSSSLPLDASRRCLDGWVDLNLPIDRRADSGTDKHWPNVILNGESLRVLLACNRASEFFFS